MPRLMARQDVAHAMGDDNIGGDGSGINYRGLDTRLKAPCCRIIISAAPRLSQSEL